MTYIYQCNYKLDLSPFRYSVRVMVFNATFNNISAILWWSVLLVEETRLLRENY